MTEEDAREKWCPFARVLPQDGETHTIMPAGNRVQLQTRGVVTDHGPVKGAYCLASSCMAWRVTSGAVHSMDGGKGYCGLAGRPE